MKSLLSPAQRLEIAILLDRFLFKDAVLYLDCTESELRKACSEKKIEHHKPSHKKVVFRKRDLDNYLFRNPVSSDAQDMAASDFVFNRKRKAS